MSPDKKYTLTEAFLMIPAAGVLFGGMFLIYLPLSLLSTYVHVLLWNWFVVPYFHLVPISFWFMYAFGITLSAFKSIPTKSSDFKPAFSDYFANYAVNVFAYALAWSFGYILHVYLIAR